jgi:uncharacterized protein (UPF0147 family)
MCRWLGDAAVDTYAVAFVLEGDIFQDKKVPSDLRACSHASVGPETGLADTDIEPHLREATRVEIRKPVALDLVLFDCPRSRHVFQRLRLDDSLVHLRQKFVHDTLGDLARQAEGWTFSSIDRLTAAATSSALRAAALSFSLIDFIQRLRIGTRKVVRKQ